MKRAFAFLLAFAFLYLGTGMAMQALLPGWMRWQMTHCLGEVEPMCALSAVGLRYWWIAALPVVTGIAMLLVRAITPTAPSAPAPATPPPPDASGS